MRFLLALLLFAGSAVHAETLDSLKKQFPDHVAGPVTDKSDPAIQLCWKKYRERVMNLRPEKMDVLKQIQDAATFEFTHIEARLRRDDSRKVMTAANRHAEAQNVAWLKQKLIPYLKRLAQFQRGR